MMKLPKIIKRSEGNWKPCRFVLVFSDWSKYVDDHQEWRPKMTMCPGLLQPDDYWWLTGFDISLFTHSRYESPKLAKRFMFYGNQWIKVHPAAFLTPGFGGGCDLPLLEPAERLVGPDDQVGKGQQVDDASDRVDAAPTAMAHSDRRFDLDYYPISSLRLTCICNRHLICLFQKRISHVFLQDNCIWLGLGLRSLNTCLKQPCWALTGSHDARINLTIQT